MKIFMTDDTGNGRKPVSQMSYAQAKQAAAIMDCIGRLIPQEGVDYDVEVAFKGEYNPSVSMGIVPHTDKGEWWRRYVSEMIRKYPPTVENPEQAIEEPEAETEAAEKKDKADNAEVVS